MTMHEIQGPNFRRIAPERYEDDQRNIVEMLRDATITSPDGHIYFSDKEQARYDGLEAVEQELEVVEAAERIVAQATGYIAVHPHISLGRA